VLKKFPLGTNGKKLIITAKLAIKKEICSPFIFNEFIFTILKKL
jgi:hypothetical protein